MKLTILGCYSGTPHGNKNSTAQVLEIKSHTFLIDCGEGTQLQLRKNKVKFSRIKHIFISHLHGDHFYGLIGLISTFRLLGREADLTIYGPKGIKEIIVLQLKLSKSWTNYNLIFKELNSKSSELIFEDDNVIVDTIPLDHRIYTNGFMFTEKNKERRLNMNAVLNAHVHVSYYQRLKNGDDVINEDGQMIKNSDLTFKPAKPKRYAFCSDTAFKPLVKDQIKRATLLYHEATFLDEHQNLCDRTKHSTAKQAAEIAKLAEVGTLLLGHFSARYSDINLFKKEAQTVFENVILANDGKIIEFKNL